MLCFCGCILYKMLPPSCKLLFLSHSLLAVYVDTLGSTAFFPVVGLYSAVMPRLFYHFPCCRVFGLLVVFLPPWTWLQWTLSNSLHLPSRNAIKSWAQRWQPFKFFLWQMNYHERSYSRHQHTGVPVPHIFTKICYYHTFYFMPIWRMKNIWFLILKEQREFLKWIIPSWPPM